MNVAAATAEYRAGPDADDVPAAADLCERLIAGYRAAMHAACADPGRSGRRALRPALRLVAGRREGGDLRPPRPR